MSQKELSMLKEYQRKVASAGGKALVKKRGSDYMRELQKRGVISRMKRKAMGKVLTAKS